MAYRERNNYCMEICSLYSRAGVCARSAVFVYKYCSCNGFFGQTVDTGFRMINTNLVNIDFKTHRKELFEYPAAVL